MIGHDGWGVGAGWHLARVDVEVPSAGKKYSFPCNKWLDKDQACAVCHVTDCSPYISAHQSSGYAVSRLHF